MTDVSPTQMETDDNWNHHVRRRAGAYIRRETEIIEMVDLEGQDHGPSSSSVGDNDDDFIVYSKEGNNARWFKKEGDEVSAEDILCEVETDNATVAMECTEEVFLTKIIHGDGANVIKVGEVNATTMEDEDDIAKFKYYKPSQLVDSKEAKVPSDPSPPIPPKKEDTEPISSAEPKKPVVANAPQSGARIFASPLARKLVPLSKIKGTGSDGTIVQADIEDYLASSGKGVSAPPTSKPKDKATEAGINYTDLPISQIRKDADKKGLSKIADEVKSFTQKAKENSLKPEDYEGGTFTVSNLGGTYGIKQFCAIINPPQSGILAVGSVEKRVVPGAGPDQYTFASYMSVTLSYDHRVIDGFGSIGGGFVVIGEWQRWFPPRPAVPVSEHKEGHQLKWKVLIGILQVTRGPILDDRLTQFQTPASSGKGVSAPPTSKPKDKATEDADKKGLSKIADEVKSFTQKAKENSLKPEDYEGGTFTVSNLGGTYGIKQFCAIINPPQSGILAVGPVEKRVVPGAGPDQYTFASYMSVTLSCDHRVIDGA
ncbi:hypothetical protein Sjap_017980 [Stephania japonica]|uniref:Dihydrolipoamide acetyltransferase component of pyruvate dehydrogenase complex n=1 Tax=Stephania japonica TaxID=461633 RepID=A0AAP0I796_9MAGN